MGSAENIVDKCIENPKLAFLVAPLGIALVIWGVSDARYYRALADKPTAVMKEVTIESRPNDRGFTIPHLVGKLGDEEVQIPVSAKAARDFQPVDQIEIVKEDDASGKYVLRSSVDSQISSIFFTAAGIPINHIALLGLVIGIGACGWGTLAKPKKPATAQNPVTAEQ